MTGTRLTRTRRGARQLKFRSRMRRCIATMPGQSTSRSKPTIADAARDSTRLLMNRQSSNIRALMPLPVGLTMKQALTPSTYHRTHHRSNRGRKLHHLLAPTATILSSPIPLTTTTGFKISSHEILPPQAWSTGKARMRQPGYVAKPLHLAGANSIRDTDSVPPPPPPHTALVYHRMIGYTTLAVEHMSLTRNHSGTNLMTAVCASDLVHVMHVGVQAPKFLKKGFLLSFLPA